MTGVETNDDSFTNPSHDLSARHRRRHTNQHGSLTTRPSDSSPEFSHAGAALRKKNEMWRIGSWIYPATFAGLASRARSGNETRRRFVKDQRRKKKSRFEREGERFADQLSARWNLVRGCRQAGANPAQEWKPSAPMTGEKTAQSRSKC